VLPSARCKGAKQIGTADNSDDAIVAHDRNSLAQLRRFEHFLGSKYLRSLESTPEGRHYSGIGDTGASAVIYGDGWSGSSSFSFCSK
jgi:hypothetical protein